MLAPSPPSTYPLLHSGRASVTVRRPETLPWLYVSVSGLDKSLYEPWTSASLNARGRGEGHLHAPPLSARTLRCVPIKAEPRKCSIQLGTRRDPIRKGQVQSFWERGGEGGRQHLGCVPQAALGCARIEGNPTLPLFCRLVITVLQISQCPHGQVSPCRPFSGCSVTTSGPPGLRSLL